MIRNWAVRAGFRRGGMMSQDSSSSSSSRSYQLHAGEKIMGDRYAMNVFVDGLLPGNSSASTSSSSSLSSSKIKKSGLSVNYAPHKMNVTSYSGKALGRR